MSFIDKILDKMSLNSEDDEEFDNEDYYIDAEEEEELPRNPFRRKKEAVEEETAIKSTRRDTCLLYTSSISPDAFLMDKINNIEITPAQLALDPCTGSCVITDVKLSLIHIYKKRTSSCS